MRAGTLKPRSARERKDFGKSFGRGVCQSQYAGALTLCDAFADSTKQNGRRLRGKTRNRALADVAIVRAASCDAHERSFGVLAAEQGEFLLLDFEHQLDGFGQVLQARGWSPALAVCTGHFRTEGDKPLSVPLNEGRKLAGQRYSARSLLYGASLTRRITSSKPAHPRAFSP